MIYLISDTHFGHANILTFRGLDGELIRPGFKNVCDMDRTIINNWNSIVNPDDKIYHLGDVTFGKIFLDDIMPRLNGKKVLILGNHDKLKMSDYMKHFKSIYTTRLLDTIPGTDTRFLLSHYPLHPSTFDYGMKNCINVHGHIHEKTLNDPRYLNVSVERIGYKPVSLMEAYNMVEKSV